MRRRDVVIAALFMVAGLAVLLPAGATAAPATGAVAVSVLDAETGQPIADASVSMIDSAGIMWAMLPRQADGAFLADPVPPGAATVSVHAFPRYTGASGVVRDVTVTAGETLLLTVELSAQPTGAVSVSVVDAATGEHIADASVSMIDSAGVLWAMLPRQADCTFLADPVPPGAATVGVDAFALYTAATGVNRDIMVPPGETLALTVELDAIGPGPTDVCRPASPAPAESPASTTTPPQSGSDVADAAAPTAATGSGASGLPATGSDSTWLQLAIASLLIVGGGGVLALARRSRHC